MQQKPQRETDTVSITSSPLLLEQDIAFFELLNHLIACNLDLHQDHNTFIDTLKEEIYRITKGRVCLHFLEKEEIKTHSSLEKWQVQYGQHYYGTLFVMHASKDVKPYSKAALECLAAVLGMVLHHSYLQRRICNLQTTLNNNMTCGSISTLTERECELMALISQNINMKQISRHLSLAKGTIYKHIEHIYKKLGVHSRKDAVRLWRTQVEMIHHLS